MAQMMTNRVFGTTALLEKCREMVTSQREYTAALHAEWHLQTLYAEGQVNVNYDLNTGRDVFYASNSPYLSPGYNLLDAAVTRMVSALLQNSPKRDVKPIRPTESAMEESRLGKVVLDWAYEALKVEEKERRAADYFSKMGNVVVSFRFDPLMGSVIGEDEFGGEIRTGGIQMTVDNPMRWLLDPRASEFEDVRVAIRRTVQPIEWVEERFPKMRGKLDHLSTSLTDDDLYELRMLNLTQSKRGIIPTLPRDKQLCTVFEYFEKPCPDYPDGIHAVFVGSGSIPQELVHDYGGNAYGEIPAVLIPCSLVSGRLFGKTPLKFLIQANNEINAIRRQISKNARICGNPILAYPVSGGTPPAKVTNQIGQLLPYDPMGGGAPQYLTPPQMPNFVFESERGAFAMMEAMFPITLFEKEAVEKTNSAIQLSYADEIMRRASKPMIRSWELGWDAVWKMYLRLFRKFTIFPQQLEAIGPEAQVITETLTGDMISDNVTVRVVPGSAMPTSRTATFAEWMEMAKAHEFIKTLDPMMGKRFWEDVGKGDMARTYRDMTDDMELGQRNLMRIIRGEMVLPRIQDDPDVTIDKILHYMRSAEYEVQIRQDPMLEKRLVDHLRVFGLAKNQRDMAQMQAVMMTQMAGAAMGGGAPGEPRDRKGPFPAPNGGPGPSASQGFSKAANANVDQGGNPGGSK